MKDVFVNFAHHADGMTIGRSDRLETSSKNLQIIYNEDLQEIFKKDTYENGISRFFDKYGQLIFSCETQAIPKFNIVMTFIDCHGNVDVALEFFMVGGTTLTKDEKAQFMDLFNEISSNPTLEHVEMKSM